MKNLIPLTPEVQALMGSKLTFHLTGSHFFGCARPDSDIDFIAQYSEDVVDELLAAGFARMGEESDYADAGHTQGVYQRGQVQVQVVYNRAAVCMARNILSTFFAEKHLHADKSIRREMWTNLIYTLSSGYFVGSGVRADRIGLVF